VVHGDLQVGAREPGWPVRRAGSSGRGSGSVAPGMAESGTGSRGRRRRRRAPPGLPRCHAAGETGHRLPHDEQPDGPPLLVVGVQQPRPGRALDHGGEFPGQVVGVLDAGVGAQAPGRRPGIRGVSDQEHPAGSIAVGDVGGNGERQDLEVGAGPRAGPGRWGRRPTGWRPSRRPASAHRAHPAGWARRARPGTAHTARPRRLRRSGLGCGSLSARSSSWRPGDLRTRSRCTAGQLRVRHRLLAALDEDEQSGGWRTAAGRARC
jgi:hypothetical protein